MTMLTDVSFILTLKEGMFEAVLFWRGEPDYRGSANVATTAINLLWQRWVWIQEDPELAEKTRIPCPYDIWPEVRRLATPSFDADRQAFMRAYGDRRK